MKIELEDFVAGAVVGFALVCYALAYHWVDKILMALL